MNLLERARSYRYHASGYPKAMGPDPAELYRLNTKLADAVEEMAALLDRVVSGAETAVITKSLEAEIHEALGLARATQ